MHYSAALTDSSVLLHADDHIVHIQLLKRNRKGHYSNGCTAADTFWFSLLSGAQGSNRVPGQHPPCRYYSTAYEADDLDTSGI